MNFLLVSFLLSLLLTPGHVTVGNLNPDFGVLRFSQQASSPCGTSITVQPGDSLAAIAQKCEISIDAIMQANAAIKNPNLIYFGQIIQLPGTSPEDTSNSVPVTGNSTEIDQANPPSRGEQQYSVQPGDSLGAIAARLGTTLNQIMLANKTLANPNLIYSGQVLVIPAGKDPSVSEQTWIEQRVQAAAQSVQTDSLVYQPQGETERWIVVDLNTQTVHALEGSRIIRSFLVSTGTWQYPTVTGTYKIWIKLPFDRMVGPGYDLNNVPYVMYFHNGYGLHGTYWHHNFGTPMSHGCVNLQTDDAAWLYNFVKVGTVVYVR